MKILGIFFALSIASPLSYAGSPLWTYTPLTATTHSITTGQTVTVQYTVTNQSRRVQTLSLRTSPNVTQVTTTGNCTSTITLNYQESCTLTLQISGTASATIRGGPTLCAGVMMCYQPSSSNQLNVTISAPASSSKKIFVTSSLYDPRFNGSPSVAISEADTACNNDSAKPSGNGTYKALIANSSRRACTSANCVNSGSSENLNWVLAANTTYVRSDGTTTIGTTTASGIFSFPLTNSLDGTSVSLMTGLATNWTTSSSNCANWTDNTSSEEYATGYAASTSSSAINMNSNTLCNQDGQLVCVEQ